jgi:hypothetical protein
MIAIRRRLLAGFFAWLVALKNSHNRVSNPEASGISRLPSPPVIAMILGAAALLVGCTQPTAIQECAPSPGIDVVCGFAKPEDLAVLPGTDWLLISELGHGMEPGHVAALNRRDGRVVRLQSVAATPSDERHRITCGAPPEQLKPRGFHLSTSGDQTTLLVVNGGPAVRIERFAVTRGPVPGLIWQGCVGVPEHLTPNDVAALPDGGFVISHMFKPPRTRLLNFSLLLRLDTGYAARWHPQDGWQAVPGTDAAFPNGIETDPASGRIFVASTYGQDLTAVDPDGANRQRIPLPLQPDNLTWTTDGLLLVAGHTGTPWFGTRGCGQLGNMSCAFPFAVAAIDPVTLAVETIYTHSERRIPGPSVALTDGDRLYLGTFFGDRVSVVTPAAAP